MEKYEKLLDVLRGLKRCAVCFSGGIDSFFLLYAAKEALGTDNVMALTFKTDFFAQCEFERAVKGIKKLNVKHVVSELNLLANECIRKNGSDRCYCCKKQLLTAALETAKENGYENVIEGTNASDLEDHAETIQALNELNIKSPLIEAEFTKDEIIAQLFKKGFFEVVRPPDACLASRISEGQELTHEKLVMTEQAEEFIKILGYDMVRVMNTDGAAVIELEKDKIDKFMQRHFTKVETKLKQLGYSTVSVSEQGYTRLNAEKYKLPQA